MQKCNENFYESYFFIVWQLSAFLNFLSLSSHLLGIGNTHLLSLTRLCKAVWPANCFSEIKMRIRPILAKVFLFKGAQTWILLHPWQARAQADLPSLKVWLSSGCLVSILSLNCGWDKTCSESLSGNHSINWSIHIHLQQRSLLILLLAS